MKITIDQYPGLTQNLVTLGQVDLSDNDPAMLAQLAELLAEAALNVARALATQGGAETDAARYERKHGEPPF
jgi:hypothetical protein